MFYATPSTVLVADKVSTMHGDRLVPLQNWRPQIQCCESRECWGSEKCHDWLENEKAFMFACLTEAGRGPPMLLA